MSELNKNTQYHKLVDKIGESYQSAKSRVVTAVNTEMLNAYWEIGKHIIDFEQGFPKTCLFDMGKDLAEVICSI